MENNMTKSYSQTVKHEKICFGKGPQGKENRQKRVHNEGVLARARGARAVAFGHPKKHSEHSNKFKGMPNMASHWPLQQESHSDEPGRCQA
jgi:hypothetical protein